MIKKNHTEIQIGRTKKKAALQTWSTAFAIAIVTFIVFSPSLKCGFTNFDDDKFIIRNSLIVGDSINMKKIFTSRVNDNDYYPITIMSLAFNYQFGKLNPFGYHFWNVLLHVLNTLLVFLFVFTITKRNLLMASIVALFFGIHPMHVESVTWVTERKDVLFVFFFMAGLITYLHFRESRKMVWYIITIILFILSCLSKGTAATFPAILLLIDNLLDEKFKKKIFLEKIPLFIISIAFIIITYWLHKTGSLFLDIDNRTFVQKVIFASYDTLWYIVKLLIPTNLSSFYTSPELNAIPFLFYLSPFICMGIIIVCLFLRKNKIIVFGLLFYFLTIVFMLQFIHTGSGEFNMADRYIYLPSIGLLLLIAYVVNQVSQKRNKYRYFFIGLTVMYAFLFSFQTYSRTKIWLNGDTIWTDAINKDPEKCYVGYNSRGWYWLEKNNFEQALPDFNKALEINPNYSKSYNNLGLILYNQGKDEQAMIDFNKTIELDSNYAEAYCNRGLIYEKRGLPDLAIKEYNYSIKIASEFYLGYYNRGVIYLKNNQFNLALADFNKAVELNPTCAYAYGNMAAIYIYRKQYDSALIECTKAIEWNPPVSGFWLYRSQAENALGKKQEAKADAIKAQQLGLQINDAYLKELGIQ